MKSKIVAFVAGVVLTLAMALTVVPAVSNTGPVQREAVNCTDNNLAKQAKNTVYRQPYTVVGKNGKKVRRMGGPWFSIDCAYNFGQQVAHQPGVMGVGKLQVMSPGARWQRHAD